MPSQQLPTSDRRDLESSNYLVEISMAATV